MPNDAPYRILIRDLVLAASIGAYAHEHHAKQRVRINVTLEALVDATLPEDALKRVISYDRIIIRIRALLDGIHFNLVETLAERVAAIALEDPRALRATVRVEKLDVFPDTVVGIEIERSR